MGIVRKRWWILDFHQNDASLNHLNVVKVQAVHTLPST